MIYRIIPIILIVLNLSVVWGQEYQETTNSRGEIDPVALKNVLEDIYSRAYALQKELDTYYLSNSSASTTYANYKNVMSSFGVVDTRRVIFEPNGTNTGNIVFAYQRHQLGTDGDDTIENVTGATHHNLLFLSASVDDATNSLGYDYSVSNTLGFTLLMVDASDDFRVVYPAATTGAIYGKWINIVVCFTKTAF